jgi:hypothetical protein
MLEHWICNPENGLFYRKNCSYSFHDAYPTSIFRFLPHKLLDESKKINAIIRALRSDFFKPIIPQFQHSKIPIVSEANLLDFSFAMTPRSPD